MRKDAILKDPVLRLRRQVLKVAVLSKDALLKVAVLWLKDAVLKVAVLILKDAVHLSTVHLLINGNLLVY